MDAWNAHAPMYEKVFERSTWLWGRDGMTFAGICSPLLHPQRLLDVACGSGNLAITAAEMGFTVTATDWSSGMIDRLRLKLDREEYNVQRQRITTRVVDGQTLEGLEDNSFDIVTSNFGIFLFPDRNAAWNAVSRVLAPGGRVIATSWDMESNNVRIVRYCMMYSLNLQDDIHDLRTAVFTPTVNRTLVPSSFAEELEESGFQDVIVRTVHHDFSFTGAEELISGLLDNAAMASSLAKKNIESVKLTALNFIQLVLDGHPDPLSMPPSEEAITPREGNLAMNTILWNSPFAMSAIAHIAIGTVNK